MTVLKRLLVASVMLGAFAFTTASAQTPSTLEAVKKRGHVICGVNVGLGGFSLPDSQGKWSGLDIDMCNAVAAAVFGDATKAKYVPLSAQQRFLALQSGEIDMLVRNSTITLERDAGLGLQYAGINFYDGQGFMVSKKLGVKGLAELNNATICVAQHGGRNGAAHVDVEALPLALAVGQREAAQADIDAADHLAALLHGLQGRGGLRQDG